MTRSRSKRRRRLPRICHARLGAGDNVVIHNGAITGNLDVTSANANDVVTIATTAIVGGTQTLTLGEQTNNHGRRWRLLAQHRLERIDRHNHNDDRFNQQHEVDVHRVVACSNDCPPSLGDFAAASLTAANFERAKLV